MTIVLIAMAVCAVIFAAGSAAGDTVLYLRTITVSSDIELVQLTKNVWLHRTFAELPQYGRVPANGLVAVCGSDAVMIDTPWNDAQTVSVFDAVRDSLHAKITQVIVGHSHEDCMGGLGEVIRRGALSYSCEMTKQFAARDNKPLPARTFTDTLTVRCGSTVFTLYYPGGGHTADNIVVYIPAEKVLFGGCLIKAAEAKNLGNTAEAVVSSWAASVKNVTARFPDVEIVVPGHGNHGGKELLAHTINLVETTEAKK